MNKNIIAEIKRYGKTARGRQEMIKHLEGERLTLKQAVNAKCYDCMAYYGDGKQDCTMSRCPLHRFMAYNKDRLKRKDNRRGNKNTVILLQHTGKIGLLAT